MLAEMREFRPSVRACPPATDCRPVNASDFVSLLLSRRRMVRVDELGAEVRGLLDPETGVRYIIDDREYSRSLDNPSTS
jgi:hypothetical protein